ncbi:two-component response regulator [Streptomyces sp. NBC_01426]|uniref:two-component response regulator n=1 Tax=unclassified Streptomyces TaxID=2593676 RepID=UPI002E334314|nr:two-component response regulator [Streptomyces sp. NBC_01426]
MTVRGAVEGVWSGSRQRFVSEHTVQDNLKSVFATTATNNRRMLPARALGT